MSAVAVVVIVVALLLIAMLVAGLRRSTRRATHGPGDDPSFRSHAEASRGDRR
jgi:FtsZ-interacting cell division protein ZipA